MRRLATLAATLSLAAGLIATAPAVHASTEHASTKAASSNCRANKICFYKGADYGGDWWDFEPPSFGCHDADSYGGNYNHPLSVWNNTRYTISLYDGNCFGSNLVATVGPGEGIANLTGTVSGYKYV
ncbi:peptidase inhibitor family I36 protein [Kitasatospora sp. NPDC059811]|uniref:peptidase inhibitor family I36 protein n=1 Tax=Streptomycetaceae TaxID=2062 RepID=UPI0007AF0C78|nr:peptidase inhibitor family I36 protein [Streptomyces sp. MJM8645]